MTIPVTIAMNRCQCCIGNAMFDVTLNKGKCKGQHAIEINPFFGWWAKVTSDNKPRFVHLPFFENLEI